MLLDHQRTLFLFGFAIFAMMVVSLTHFYRLSQPFRPAANMQSLQPEKDFLSVPTFAPNRSFVLYSLDEIYALGRRRFPGFGNGTIPRIVHITYKSRDLPQQYEDFLRHCTRVNPDVAFLFWNDEQSEKFVSQSIERLQRINNSEEQRWSKFLSTYTGIEKADVLRLLLLYFLGGVYMDLDTECRQSFHQLHLSVGQLLNQKYHPPVSNNTVVSSDSAVSCIIDQEQWLQTRIHWSREYSAMNNFMICRPRHPFFRYVLEKMKDNDKKTHIMDKTGPFMLTARYEEYNRLLRPTTTKPFNSSQSANGTLPNSPAEESIIELAHPDWFSPLVDTLPQYEGQCKGRVHTNQWVKEACTKDIPHYKATLETRVNASFVIHRFLHLGYEYNKHLIRKNFNVSSVNGVFLVQLH